jgi:sulfatase maturation enzyme AslB (radical SAM superfamily)
MHAGLEALMAVAMNVIVCWDVIQYTLMTHSNVTQKPAATIFKVEEWLRQHIPLKQW